MKASDTFPSICVVAAALFAAYGARADATYDASTGWSGLSGTVTIPSGITAPLADGDLADFANVTSVVFESSTSKISASGLSDPIVLNAALSGAGTFSVSSCSGGLQIHSDNSGLVSPGHFSITSTKVDVYRRYGLGGASTGAATVDQGNSSSYENYPIYFRGPEEGGSEGTLNVEVKINYTNCLKIGAHPTTNELVVASEVLRQNSSTGGSTATINIPSDIRITTGKIGGASGKTHSWVKLARNAYVERSAGITTPSGLYLSGPSSSSYALYLNATGALSASAIYHYNSIRIVCNADKAVPEKAYNMEAGANLQLNGHPITITAFNNSNTTMAEKGTKVNGSNIASSEPGALFKQTSAAYNSGNGLSVQGPVFSGHVSYELYCGATQTNTFRGYDASTPRLSSSVGSLTVTRGRLQLNTAWGWGGTNVTVNGANASLVCNSTYSIKSSAAIGTGGDYSRATQLFVTNGASLAIASGVTLVVSAAHLGSATLSAGRTYTVAEINDEFGTALDGCTVSGDGAISVLEEPVAWTGWPSSGTATIPSGETVLLTDADIGNVTNLDLISVGAEATLQITTTQPLTLAAPIVGTGTITANSAGPVVLAADNSGVVSPGHFDFTDTKVTVRHPNGLGGANAGIARFRCSDTTSSGGFNRIAAKNAFLLFGNGGQSITNTTQIYIYGLYCVGAETSTDAFVQAANFRGGSNISLHSLYLTNSVSFIAGQFGPTYSAERFCISRVGSSYTVWFKDNVTLYNGNFLYDQTYRFSCSGVSGTLYPVMQGASYTIMDKANVFTSDTVISAYIGGSGYIDLNGFDQTIGYWTYVSNHGPGSSTEANKANIIKSATPATLTFGTAGSATSRGNLGVQFRGEAAARFAGDTYALCTGVSTTKGPLTIDGGKLSFKWGAAWNVATNIYLNGGTLEITATAAAEPFSKYATLAIGTGAQLLVADGQNVTVKHATLGGEYLDSGVYGGSAAQTAGLVDADHVLDAVFGTVNAGTLTVRRGAPGQGTTLLIK